MAAKAAELKEKGHSTREICQEMHLSQATVEWLLAKQASEAFSEALPADVKVGWRTIGVSGSRISSIADIMADVILEEQAKKEFDIDMIAGLTNNGIPLATIVSEILGVDFGMVRTSREGTETNYASNYAGIKSKNVILIDDVISSGSTMKACSSPLAAVECGAQIPPPSIQRVLQPNVVEAAVLSHRASTTSGTDHCS